MGARRLGRELALQMLYSRDYAAGEAAPLLELVLDESEPGAAAGRSFADDLVRGVLEHRQEIDTAITGASKNWSIGRMARVDLSILRMAMYELLFRSDIPKNVTINEAIEVAKKFGTEDSPAFINGILDEIASTLPDKG
ncbi:transcription antitermination factor NusB [Geobacter sulfurreducens]|uniref:Transcription antitermination protein NusB n=1 Tax=Geobacter sulfurreducens (strain ATCC 51573 / DSM 12127 / PCA) TaxID=243231 RepID=NUSB_GEOSL|nr:transcription antitermination factor NusB [Geobacter sulfurreducens]Q74CI1.1 RecName: Full=Transcription antitermination protein NusB; AltName: Full=Antitermination factor NusB [Geobacter sulfurreducens PCA]AAR35070.1 transcription antitermination factor NusB [Geobacter sulfurreducens PCA]ADI84526.1 transcription antitermination factor NusB [Geobacter sulfurreducens KN400]AJY71427.1 nitrogen utilization protein B [Geobacter sulfurreducens]QVW36848.1 transcription antitermination factor NusB